MKMGQSDKPLGLGCNEGLGAHIQPTNDDLRVALAAAIEENERHSPTEDALQSLWAMRARRSTWFDVEELALRKEIDEFFGDDTWITNSQYSACSTYGATPYGVGNGAIEASWPDGRIVRFHITTPLRNLYALLAARCEDPVRDMLAWACGPNVRANLETPNDC
jgi:hypothetical protein